VNDSTKQIPLQPQPVVVELCVERCIRRVKSIREQSYQASRVLKTLAGQIDSHIRDLDTILSQFNSDGD